MSSFRKGFTNWVLFTAQNPTIGYHLNQVLVANFVGYQDIDLMCDCFFGVLNFQHSFSQNISFHTIPRSQIGCRALDAIALHVRQINDIY